MRTWVKSLLFVSILLLVTNLIYVDFVFIFPSENNTVSQPFMANKQSTKFLSPIPTPSFICGEKCLALIREEVKRHLASQSANLSNQSDNNKPSPTIIQQTTTSPPSVREFYVPFGSGSTTSRDWDDIEGTDTTIDTANYTRLKEAIFEANIYIPTGNGRVFAQLFNVTGKHPAWFSEISTESRTSILLRSNPIVLDKGKNTYRVQLKSSLGVNAVMDFARVKIVVE